MDNLAAKPDRLRRRSNERLDRAHRCVAVGDPRHENGEFVAAKACNHVSGPCCIPETLRDLLEIGVAHVMTEGVVEIF